MNSQRNRLLALLAAFASVDYQEDIRAGNNVAYSDLMDLLEAWDYGPEEPSVAERFTASEIESLLAFHNTLWAFYEQVLCKRPARYQDFIYVAGTDMPQEWLEVVRSAHSALAVFGEFRANG